MKKVMIFMVLALVMYALTGGGYLRRTVVDDGGGVKTAIADSICGGNVGGELNELCDGTRAKGYKMK